MSRIKSKQSETGRGYINRVLRQRKLILRDQLSMRRVACHTQWFRLSAFH